VATAEWSVSGIVRRMLPVLIVLTAIELGSGLVLDTFEGTLLRYPTLLVLVPVTIGMATSAASSRRGSRRRSIWGCSPSTWPTTDWPATPSPPSRSR
jgi:cation transporter-like permease